MMVAIPSTMNSANAAEPTVTQLTIPSTVISANDIAVSADGSKLVLLSGSVTRSPNANGIYVSSDSGGSWTEKSSTLTQTTASTPTMAVTSDDGQKVVVTTYTSSELSISSNQGANWTTKSLVSLRSQCNNQINFLNTTAGPESTGISMSGDGSVIAIPVFNSSCLLVSTDSGTTFSKITLPVSMFAEGAVHVSKSGNAIWFAKSNSGGLWKLNTTNWTWGSNYSSTVGSPRGLTGSQDGTKIYTAGGSGSGVASFVFKSTDGGQNFSSLPGTSKIWRGIKSSADGTRLIGWDSANNVWISQDSAATWTLQNNPSATVNSVKISPDGSKAYMTTGEYGSTNPTTKVFRYAFLPPAPAFTFTSTSETASVGSVISGYSINSTGGLVDQYSISPSLSAGLSFDTSTGLITGTPTAAAASTVYTVMGTGTTGSAFATFTLRVSSCSQGGPCIIGDRGPGGGYVFYIASSNFSAPGAICANSCKLLEVAPSTWRSGGSTVADDLKYQWSSNTTVKTAQNTEPSTPQSGFTGEKYNWRIGQGFYNTSVMRVSGATSAGQAAVLAYAGNVTAGEWFIPSINELNELCKYARGRATGVLTEKCSAGSSFKNTANAGGDRGGFLLDYYQSSSEANTGEMWVQNWSNAGHFTGSKNNDDFMRPIRAFGYPKVTPPTTFVSSRASLYIGQSTTLTATVTAGATGTITFTDGSSNILCTTGTLDGSGVAACSWSPSQVGDYAVTANYSGDSEYNTKTSSPTTIQVLTNATITYNTNNGVGTAPAQGAYSGSAITLPAGTGLSKSGYTFGGWSLTETGTALTSPYSPASSLTLYAVWTANQYTITYNANSGTGTQTAGSYTTGAAATTLPATSTFSRTGYSFGGWATSAGSTTPVASYSTSATATFYAIWTRGTYNVRFLANDGVGSMETQTSSATANLTTNAFTFTDRTFTGWNTSADGTGIAYSNSQSYPFLANLTLYARWGNLISFSSQGATSGSPSFASQSWTSGAINLATFGTMVKTGYTFGGWTNGTTTFAGGASYTPTAGITLNPVWNAVTYTISYNANLATGGTVPSNQSWTTGTTALTLSGNTGTLVKSGYTFGGWATTASSTTPVTTHSTSANRIFYAIWTPVNYTITYALAGGTSTLPTQANQRISNSFTLASTPTRANYNFAGWSDSRTAYGALATYTITASTPSAVTLTAQWIPVYTVSYILNGSTDSVTAPALYDSGTVISIAVAPTLTGHTFAGWVDSSNNLRAASSSFTVVQNSTLQARWTAISYSVTYNLGGASGTLPLQSSLTINQNFQVAPTPIRAGYIFTGWSESSTVYAAGSTYVIASSNVLLTAQWAAIAYAVTFDLGGGVGTLPTRSDGFIGSTFALPSTGSNPTQIAHTFTGWSDGSALYAAGSTYTFSAADVTLTAQFSLNGYTQINYSLGISGAGALPTQSSKLEGNTIIVASGAGITRANYAFAGWSDGTATYQPGDVYLVGPEAAPVTFVPSWTSGYNVTYSTGSGFGIAPVDPVGRVTGSTFTVASSSTVSRQGFTFTGWSDGSAIFAPGATYTVASSNITLTAQWVQNSLAGIPNNALTPLANFSIVNGVGPAGSFNFGSSSVSYEIPVNALSAGTVISIYGLTDFSSLAGVVPSGKTVVSSTVIAWLGTDGTVQDTNSPIKMTITDSQIVPGSVVYAVTGGELTLLGTATTNGSITTTIVSDPVILIANPVVTTTNPPSSSREVSVSPAPAPAPVSVVVDNSAALAAAKELAEKKAAEEAAALKIAAEAKAAEEAALKAAQEKMAADAKALAEAKAAADAAAIKAAQDAADASAKAAAALQAAKDAEIAAANAAKAIKPAVTLYSLSSSLKLNAYDSAYLNKYVKSLKNGASVTCIGYSYSKNISLKKATALAKSQATAVCALMKKTNKTLKTSVIVYPATKAPKAATGAKWVGVSYRIDGFKN